MAKGFAIEGLAKLDAVVKRKAAEIHAAAVAAIAQEVDAVEADAKAGAPVKAGALRDGIGGTAKGTTGQVESTARHSAFVEGGTYKDQAQPFMGPAAMRSRARFPAAAAGLLRTAAKRK